MKVLWDVLKKHLMIRDEIIETKSNNLIKKKRRIYIIIATILMKLQK